MKAHTKQSRGCALLWTNVCKIVSHKEHKNATVNGYSSVTAATTSDGPQDSILDPLLSILAMKDLSDTDCDSEVVIDSDGTALYTHLAKVHDM